MEEHSSGSKEIVETPQKVILEAGNDDMDVLRIMMPSRYGDHTQTILADLAPAFESDPDH